MFRFDDTFSNFFSIPNAVVSRSLLKCQDVLFRHNRISVSISGGSDSDIVLDMIMRTKSPDSLIKFVWFDTGFEYQATKNHLFFLESKYGISIDRFKAVKPIPLSIQQYGVPFLSKFVSAMISRLQKHNFCFEDEPFDVLISKYPNCSSALRWWCNLHKSPSCCISQHSLLKEFLISNPPSFPISDSCCYYSKKLTAKRFEESWFADLQVSGVRKSERGIRSVSYKSCFTSGLGIDSFRPVFWFSDSDKRFYESTFDVIHSDCYLKYGLKRTGCVGCPFGRDFEKELDIIKLFEPRLFNAVNSVFGASYNYTRLFREFRSKFSCDRKLSSRQFSVFDL